MINGLYIINTNTFWFMCYKVVGNITTISSNIRNKNLITNISWTGIITMDNIILNTGTSVNGSVFDVITIV